MSIPVSITALDVAEEFIRRHRDTVRYEHTSGDWLVFNSRLGWRRDDHQVEVRRLVINLLKNLASFVPPNISTLEARRFTKTRQSSMQKLKNQGSINSILTLASHHRSLLVDAERIDARRDVLVAPNGVIDLRTGTGGNHENQYVALRRIGTDFDPTARCPRFERFLDEVLGTDADVRAYRQPWLGYLLTGETRQHQMWLLTGAGSNAGSYSNPIADRLIKATNVSNSTSAFAAYENFLAKQLPWLWEPNGDGASEVAKNITGATPLNSLYSILPETWHIK